MVYEKKNRSLVFSGSRKIPTLGSIVQWETREASFPTGTVGPRVGIFLSPLNTLGSTIQWETRKASFPSGTVGPRVGIFLSPLNTNDGFYLSHTPVPALGNDKKGIAARRPHAGRTSIRDVIVMLK